MRWDSEPAILRAHSDRSVLDLKLSGFRPTAKVLNQPDLPDRYIAIQFRRNDLFKPPSRNILNGEEHDAWAGEFISRFDLPVISLSDYVGGVDMSHLDLWQKIHVAQHAEKLYVSHSGFGMVMGMYGDAEVINCSGTRRNPSLGVFKNVETRLYPQQDGPYVTAEYSVRPV